MFGLPVHVCDVLAAYGPEDGIVYGGGAFALARLPSWVELRNCTAHRHAIDDDRETLVADLTKRAASHIATSLFSYVATGTPTRIEVATARRRAVTAEGTCSILARAALFSPQPLLAAWLMLALAVTNILRARFLWYFHDCLDVVELMFPYHAAALALAVTVGHMQSHVMRRQFLMRSRPCGCEPWRNPGGEPGSEPGRSPGQGAP